MFCTKCGVQRVSDAAPFCTHCGSPVVMASTPTSAQTPGALASVDQRPLVTVAEGVTLCPFCKEEIRFGAITCKHCNSILNVQDAVVSAPASTPTPDQIRAELRRYDTLTTMTCLECGYSGSMGVVGVIKGKAPWFLSWWVLIPLLLTGVGTIPALLAFGGRAMSIISTQRTKALCPVCKKTLIERLKV